jgi:hypothetical protein
VNGQLETNHVVVRSSVGSMFDETCWEAQVNMVTARPWEDRTASGTTVMWC